MRAYILLRQEPFKCKTTWASIYFYRMPDISIQNLSLTNKCNNDWECHLNAKMAWKEQGQYWHAYPYTKSSSTVYKLLCDWH